LKNHRYPLITTATEPVIGINEKNRAHRSRLTNAPTTNEKTKNAKITIHHVAFMNPQTIRAKVEIIARKLIMTTAGFECSIPPLDATVPDRAVSSPRNSPADSKLNSINTSP
jgi:hypothetical protein